MLPKFLGRHRSTALLDVQHRDAVRLDPCLKGLDVVRHDLENTVGARKGRVVEFRCADIGDVLVHEVTAEPLCYVGHEARADYGPVGFVQVTFQGPDGGYRTGVEILAAGDLGARRCGRRR